MLSVRYLKQEDSRTWSGRVYGFNRQETGECSFRRYSRLYVVRFRQSLRSPHSSSSEFYLPWWEMEISSMQSFHTTLSSIPSWSIREDVYLEHMLCWDTWCFKQTIYLWLVAFVCLDILYRFSKDKCRPRNVNSDRLLTFLQSLTSVVGPTSISWNVIIWFSLIFYIYAWSMSKSSESQAPSEKVPAAFGLYFNIYRSVAPSSQNHWDSWRKHRIYSYIRHTTSRREDGLSSCFPLSPMGANYYTITTEPILEVISHMSALRVNIMPAMTSVKSCTTTWVTRCLCV